MAVLKVCQCGNFSRTVARNDLIFSTARRRSFRSQARGILLLLYFLQKFLPRVFRELPPGRFDRLFTDFDWLTAIIGKTFRRLANRGVLWAVVQSIREFLVFHDKSPFSKNSWHADLCR